MMGYAVANPSYDNVQPLNSVAISSTTMSGEDSSNSLHLSFEQGVLSLSLDGVELFRKAIALSPSQIILSLEGASSLLTSCSSSHINGTSKASCIIKKM